MAVPGTAAAVVTSLPDLEWGDRVSRVPWCPPGRPARSGASAGGLPGKLPATSAKEIGWSTRFPLTPTARSIGRRSRALFTRNGAGDGDSVRDIYLRGGGDDQLRTAAAARSKRSPRSAIESALAIPSRTSAKSTGSLRHCPAGDDHPERRSTRRRLTCIRTGSAETRSTPFENWPAHRARKRCTWRSWTIASGLPRDGAGGRAEKANHADGQRFVRPLPWPGWDVGSRCFLWRRCRGRHRRPAPKRTMTRGTGTR